MILKTKKHTYFFPSGLLSLILLAPLLIIHLKNLPVLREKRTLEIMYDIRECLFTRYAKPIAFNQPDFLNKQDTSLNHLSNCIRSLSLTKDTANYIMIYLDRNKSYDEFVKLYSTIYNLVDSTKDYYFKPFYGDDLNLSMTGHCIYIYYLAPKPWPEDWPEFRGYYLEDACIPTTFNLSQFEGDKQTLPSQVTDFISEIFSNKDTVRYALLKPPPSLNGFVALWNTVRPIVKKYKSANPEILGNELRMTKKGEGIAIFYAKSYAYSNKYLWELSCKQNELSSLEKIKYWYQGFIVELKDKPIINLIPLMLISMLIIDIRTIKKISILRNSHRQLTSGSS